MNKINIKQLIKQLIIKRRMAVIDSLKVSGIQISKNINNKSLYDLIMSELINGNESLIMNLGNVIDKTFDMRKYATENFSNWTDANTGSAIGAGSSILTAWINKDKGAASSGGGYSAPSSGGNTDMMGMMMLQQQASDDRRRDESIRREEADARKGNTMMIVGVIAGVIVIGGIVTFVATR